MADSTCLVRGFSYPSPVPNESPQGNLMLALGDSVSFGRFLNESLSWEKRSSFLHRNYVEEAERYSRPGSVAQKKAYFEAHYKRIAAKKAAEVFEQEAGEDGQKANANDEQRDVHAVDMERDKILNAKESLEERPVGKSPAKINSLKKLDVVSVSESSETPKMERSLPKPDSVANEDIPMIVKNGSGSNLSSSRAWNQHKTLPAKQVFHLEKQSGPPQGTMKSSVDSTGVKRSSSKSSSACMETPAKEPYGEPKSVTMGTGGHAHSSATTVVPSPVKGPDWGPISATTETENPGNAPSSTIPMAPLNAPVAAQSDRTSTNPVANLQSESTRAKIPVGSLRGKSTSRKWHHFSSVFSKSLTEKGAAKSKQRLEENFTATASQNIQQRKSFKDKTGNKFRKFRCLFCFRDSDLVDQTRIPENQGTISMLSTPSKRLFKNSSKNNSIRTANFPAKSFTDRIAHENTLTNIQQ